MKWIISLLIIATFQAAGIKGDEERDWNTCVDRCVESFFPGRPCYCNSACTQYENCCFDYIRLCAPEMAINDTWTDFKGKTYKYFDDGTITAQAAHEACRDEAGMLVSINSLDEMLYIEESVLQHRPLSAFIGGSDQQQEGRWMWADGSSMPLPSTSAWHEWYTGEPDNADDSEHCSILTNYEYWASLKNKLERYVWRDYSCVFNPALEIQGYICERTLKCNEVTCENGGRCVYISGPEEFECLCPESFVGDRCQYEVIAGEAWTICGDTNLTATQGVIESPLFPKQYPPNTMCEWLISLQSGTTLSLTIDHLDLEESKRCALDGLTVYNGPSTDSPVLFGPLCGTPKLHGRDVILEFQEAYDTSSSEILVQFITDEDIAGTGFSLHYLQGECGYGTGESGCDTPGIFTAECGEIEVEQGLNDGFDTCEWRIQVQPGLRINLTTEHFRLYDAGHNCSAGGLVLYDGNSTDSPVLERLCGWRAVESHLSTSEHLLMRLEGLDFRPQDSIVMAYNSFNNSFVGDSTNPYTEVQEGTLFDLASDFIYNENNHIYQWSLEVMYGDVILIEWHYNLIGSATLEVYSGHEASPSSLYLALDNTTSPLVNVSVIYYSALVQLTCHEEECYHTNFQAIYRAIEWHPEESGCYRPALFSSTTHSELENSLIGPIHPLMLMVSSQAQGSVNPGYSPGLYCKWNIQARPGARLSIDIIEANIHPVSRDCKHDGFVVIAGNDSRDIRGPFCGKESLAEYSIGVNSNEMILIFYSDNNHGWRNDGILRALITQQPNGDESDCPVYQMSEPGTQRHSAACGVILSPQLPGLVPPGLWFWVFKPPSGRRNHYSLYVYYVRGPGIEDEECDHSFKVIEIPQDSQELRQYEADLVSLCGDTELFQPHSKIRLPPTQQLGIQLRTISSSLFMQWHFKLGFETETMPPPKQYQKIGNCPGEYIEWRGQCYHYYPWSIRHYQEEAFAFQSTWQLALQRCESENGSLFSMYDQEEAYFIQYTLATTNWFWDEAAPYKQNHRLLLMGLHNRQGPYRWTTGVNLGYADWYQPQPDWSQPPVHDDSYLPQILNLGLRQPTADSSSLCTAALPISPFGSMNWVKIPCDFPLFRAGVICKQPVRSAHGEVVANGETETITDSSDSLTSNGDVHSSTTRQTTGTFTPGSAAHSLTESSYVGCRQGWIFITGSCYLLHTNYVHLDEDDISTGVLTYTDADRACEDRNGTLSNLRVANHLDSILVYLDMWNHTLSSGDILIGAENETCSYLHVYKDDAMGIEVQYRLLHVTCHDDNMRVSNVLCMQEPQVVKETCGVHEFTCSNGMCVSVDHVCDGQDDCKDNSDEHRCGCGEDTFQCKSGHCVSISLRCDFIPHCADASDEAGCETQECGVDEFRCDNGQCISATGVCDFSFQCVDHSDETPSLCAGVCDGFQCYSGMCLDPSLALDNMADCPGQLFEDEREANTELSTFFGLNEEADLMTNSSQIDGCVEGPEYIMCHSGERRCFPRSSICVYDTQMMDESRDYTVLASCRDGVHLRKTCHDVECPGMYHCESSYCIPHRKICDGQVDCPHGDDEQRCHDYTCPGRFHCKGSDICVPHSEVCDGVPNCPMFGEDEKYCHQQDVLCEDCHCVGHVVHCADHNLTSLAEPTSVGVRQFRGLYAAYNSITRLSTAVFRHMHWLTKIDLSHNHIRRIESFAFEDLRNLLELDLSFNYIAKINHQGFNGLINLKVLNLKHNALTTIQADQIFWLVSLEKMVLEDNELDNVEKGTFDELASLDTLNAHAYKICCVAKHVSTCTPEADEFSSCEDLMANYTLQLAIWVLGIVALTGNAFVIIWRWKTDRKKSSSFFIINLGFSDLLMGIYLIIIASVDVHYRGNYIVHADWWRSSWLCQLAGVIATVSSEVSVFMLTTITMERCLTLIYPLRFGKMRIRNARAIAAVGWILCILLSVFPLTRAPMFGDAFYGRTGVCLPFVVSSQRLPGWEYSVFIFLVLNLFSFIIIFIGYTAIFITVKSSIQSMGAKSTGSADEYALAKKLAIIVASDFMCWVPIIMIGFAALGGATISPEVSAWIAVFILPLNSAMNPLLYTISAIQCGRPKRKKGAMITSTIITSGTMVTKAPTYVSNGDDKSKSNNVNGENGHNGCRESTKV